MQSESNYNDTVVRQFAIMTVVWGVVGMLVGVVIAAQLIWPSLTFDVPWLTYSRLRPLHRNCRDERRSCAHRLNRSEGDVSPIQHRERQQVQEREIHVHDDAEPQHQPPTVFVFE